MKYSFGFLVVILLLVFSCGKTEKAVDIVENQDSVVVKPTQILHTIGETLIPSARKDMQDWQEYKEIDEFIMKFYSTSVMEALADAKELSELTQRLKDSVRVEKIDQVNVMARFNVLHNEALRLADMANIPSITNDEVKEEVGKILELYSAVNSKINTIYKAEELQNNLEVDTEKPVDLDGNSKRPTRPKRRTTTSSIQKKTST